MKDYYFTGQNSGAFFYFYCGKILKTSHGEKMSDNYHIIGGFHFDKNQGFEVGRFKVPQRYDKHDMLGQYDVDKDTAYRGTVKLILGDN